MDKVRSMELEPGTTVNGYVVVDAHGCDVVLACRSWCGVTTTPASAVHDRSVEPCCVDPKNWRRVRGALSRCLDERNVNFRAYGGRGIRVCTEWLMDPWDFLQHLLMLEGCDVPRLLLDRVDNEGHYEPGNLRFCTRGESYANTRARKGGWSPWG